MAASDQGTKQLFLSYGHEDHVNSFALKLKQDLEQKGFTVWMDVNIAPGRKWVGGIGSGILHCRGLIAIITNKYVNSEYCTSELSFAKTEKKNIFPIKFEDDVDFTKEPNAPGVKWIAHGHQWVKFRPSVDDYGKSLDELVVGLEENGIHPGDVETTDAGRIEQSTCAMETSDSGTESKKSEDSSTNGSASVSSLETEVPDEELGITDLYTLKTVLKDVSYQWKDIGLALKLQQPKLNILKADHLVEGQDQCLSAMLQNWLQWDYEIEKYGKPTWRMLVKALESVSDCKTTANQIKKEKPWRK